MNFLDNHIKFQVIRMKLSWRLDVVYKNHFHIKLWKIQILYFDDKLYHCPLTTADRMCLPANEQNVLTHWTKYIITCTYLVQCSGNVSRAAIGTRQTRRERRCDGWRHVRDDCRPDWVWYFMFDFKANQNKVFPTYKCVWILIQVFYVLAF